MKNYLKLAAALLLTDNMAEAIIIPKGIQPTVVKISNVLSNQTTITNIKAVSIPAIPSLPTSHPVNASASKNKIPKKSECKECDGKDSKCVCKGKKSKSKVKKSKSKVKHISHKKAHDFKAG